MEYQLLKLGQIEQTLKTFFQLDYLRYVRKTHFKMTATSVLIMTMSQEKDDATD